MTERCAPSEADIHELLRTAEAGWACFASKVVRLPVTGDANWGVLLECELLLDGASLTLRRVDERVEGAWVREGQGSKHFRDEVSLLARDGFGLLGRLRYHRYWSLTASPGGCDEWRPAFSRFIGFTGAT